MGGQRHTGYLIGLRSASVLGLKYPIWPDPGWPGILHQSSRPFSNKAGRQQSGRRLAFSDLVPLIPGFPSGIEIVPVVYVIPPTFTMFVLML